jgi:1-deoxy-D-xylulose-5-phosphate reductoisomerase
VLNAANEVAVEAFLAERLSLVEIPAVIERALERHAGEDAGDVDALLELDSRVRRAARELLPGRVG